MNTFGDPRRIQRASRMLAMACDVLLFLLPLALVGYWATADEKALAMHAHLSPFAIEWPVAMWQRAAGAAVSGVSLALLMMGLWEARKCFRLFAGGEYFAAAAVRCLRRFAGWVAAAVAARIVAESALSVLLTINNPPGARQLAISLSSDLVLALLFAGMVWVMAAVIGRGQALADENATFV
jgi:hypothetical protein